DRRREGVCFAEDGVERRVPLMATARDGQRTAVCVPCKWRWVVHGVNGPAYPAEHLILITEDMVHPIVVLVCPACEGGVDSFVVENARPVRQRVKLEKLDGILVQAAGR